MNQPNTIPTGQINLKDLGRLEERQQLALYCQQVMEKGLFPGTESNPSIDLMNDGMRIALGKILEYLRQ